MATSKKNLTKRKRNRYKEDSNQEENSMPKTVPDNDFHRNVLAILEARHQGICDLARAMGVARGNVFGILKHGRPTLKTVRRFAEALGVDPATFLDGNAAEVAVARSELAAARTELAAARLEAALEREQ
jgi:DNA-binding phage protein